MLKSFYQKKYIEAGCDEAGRGCFAGPVFAAAVILPKTFSHPLLNDSKLLPAATRYELRPIIEAEAICYGVASISPEEIDVINILRASFKAMHHALDMLHVAPELLLIDGNRFTAYKQTPHRCIVKGDSLYSSIAAASILAKTYRDDFMRQLHEEFPHYKWNANKGYGTEEHRKAIGQFGYSPYHRRTFQLKPKQLELDMDMD